MQQQHSTRTTSGDGLAAPAAEENITLMRASKLAAGRSSANCVWL